MEGKRDEEVCPGRCVQAHLCYSSEILSIKQKQQQQKTPQLIKKLIANMPKLCSAGRYFLYCLEQQKDGLPIWREILYLLMIFAIKRPLKYFKVIRTPHFWGGGDTEHYSLEDIYCY